MQGALAIVHMEKAFWHPVHSIIGSKELAKIQIKLNNTSHLLISNLFIRNSELHPSVHTY
jgi:hypothetical protein